MFREHLRNVVDQVEGGLACLLMGFDGIPVDSYVKEGRALDIQMVGEEFSVIVSQVRATADILALGKLEDLVVRTDTHALLLHVIDREYFIALAISVDGNLGKGRYLLRVTSPKLKAEM